MASQYHSIGSHWLWIFQVAMTKVGERAVVSASDFGATAVPTDVSADEG